MPSQKEKSKLGYWASNQKYNYSKGNLSQDRINKLENLSGWFWDGYHERRWDITFSKLKDHIDRYKQYPRDGNKGLGAWVWTQRSTYNKGKLEKDRIKKLESLPNWVWDTLDSRWSTNYEKLKKYIAANMEYPSQRVPLLGNWVAIQRRSYKKGKLEKEKIKLLERLDQWLWTPITGRRKR